MYLHVYRHYMYTDTTRQSYDTYTHTGSDNDLEYFVRACGDILGVTSKLLQDRRTGKHILEYIFGQLVVFKKSSQVLPIAYYICIQWMMNVI